MNFKAFSMITNKNDAKKMTEHISCNCKCKLNGTTCNSKQKQNVTVKIIVSAKKDYSWNPSK